MARKLAVSKSNAFSDANDNYRVSNDDTRIPRQMISAGKTRVIFSGVFFGAVIMIIILMCFLVTHFETNQQLKDLNKSDRYIHNLTKQLTELNMQIKTGSVGTRYRNSRIDYAQYSQGAKVLKFQGVEIPTDASVMDRVKQFLGLYVARGACRVLGKQLNKNTFLAFKGNKAALKIKLNQRIFLDTLKIDHYIDDLRNPNVVSAMPKDFAFYGYRDDSTDPILIGRLSMNLNRNSKSQSAVMHFQPKESYDIYKVEITSNHGNNDLTKLYKIRMHGQVDDLH